MASNNYSSRGATWPRRYSTTSTATCQPGRQDYAITHPTQSFAVTSTMGQMVADDSYQKVDANSMCGYVSQQQVALLPAPSSANPVYNEYDYARTVNTPRYYGMKTYYPQPVQTPYWAAETTTHCSATCTANTKFTNVARPAANLNIPANTQEYGYAAAPETPSFTTNYEPIPSTDTYSSTNAAAQSTTATATNEHNTCQQEPSEIGSVEKCNTKPTILKKLANLLYCDVCKVSCYGLERFRIHCRGKKHRNKETTAKFGKETTAKFGKKTTHCELCDVTCGSAGDFAAHVQGKKHQWKVKLQTTLGKPIPSIEPVVVNKLSTMATNTVVLSPAPEMKESLKTVNGQLWKLGEFPKTDDKPDIKMAEKNYFEEIENNMYQFNSPNVKEMHMKEDRHTSVTVTEGKYEVKRCHEEAIIAKTSTDEPEMSVTVGPTSSVKPEMKLLDGGGTTNSGCDAALNRITTMCVQQQQQQQVSAAFVNKDYITTNKPEKLSKSQHVCYCDLSAIGCNGVQYRQYLEGVKLKYNEAVKAAKCGKIEKLVCKLCNVTTSKLGFYFIHIQGGRHRKELENLVTLLSLTETFVNNNNNNNNIAVSTTINKSLNEIPANNVSIKEIDSAVTELKELLKFLNEEQRMVEDFLKMDDKLENQLAGEDYFEDVKNNNGDVIGTKCKLCNCLCIYRPERKTFHVLGIRHRRAYKAKVNPDMELEIQPTSDEIKLINKLKQLWQSYEEKRVREEKERLCLEECVHDVEPGQNLCTTEILARSPMSVTEENHEIKRCKEEAAIVMTDADEPKTSVTITLTSPVKRGKNHLEGGLIITDTSTPSDRSLIENQISMSLHSSPSTYAILSVPNSIKEVSTRYVNDTSTSLQQTFTKSIKVESSAESQLFDANSKELEMLWGDSKVMDDTLDDLPIIDNDFSVWEKFNSRKKSIESRQRLTSSLESIAAGHGVGGGGVKRKSDINGEGKSLIVKKVRLDSDAKFGVAPTKSPMETVTEMRKQLSKKDLEEFIAKEIEAFLSDEHRYEFAEMKGRIVKLEKAKDYWKRQATILHKLHVEDDIAIQRLSKSLKRTGTIPPTKIVTRSVGLQVQTQVPSVKECTFNDTATTTITTPTTPPPSTMKLKSSSTPTPKSDVRLLSIKKSPGYQSPISKSTSLMSPRSWLSPMTSLPNPNTSILNQQSASSAQEKDSALTTPNAKVMVVVDDGKISSQNIDEEMIIHESQLNARTLNVTRAALSIFRRFMASVGEKRELVDLPPTDLGRCLTKFFAHAKKRDGSEYGARTLTYIFDSIDRHLKSNNYSVSIRQDETFYTAREQLRRRRRQLQRKKKSTVGST